MRDLLVLAIVGLGALTALKRPWIGVLLWTWISIMNPHRYAWGIAYSAPVAAIAAGATVLGFLFTRDRHSPFQGAAVWWFAGFSLWITICWRFGVDPQNDLAQWEKVMKIYFMTFVALALLSSKQHIVIFTWVAVGSLMLIAVKGGIFTIAHGGNYRVWGPPGSFIADNNSLALATVVAIPMMRFLQLQLRNFWLRHGMTVAILLCAASALGSQSRGGLLALAAMAVVFWWRSRHKVNIGIAIAIGALLLLPMMPEHWWDRMQTIGSYTQDASAMGRINAWHVAWEVATHNFFGGGMSYQYQFLFDRYGTYETTVRAAHSIYFEVLGNHGFVGLFIYLMLWFQTYRTAGWLRKHGKGTPETDWTSQLGAMAQVSILGFAVGGAFLSLSYFDLPYDIMIMVVLAKKWVERKAWETETVEPLPWIGGWLARREKQTKRLGPRFPAGDPAMRNPQATQESPHRRPYS